jgi:hypothetical protein
MTICLLTCVYRRPKIFDVFLKNYIYLKHEFRNYAELKLVVVGNKDEDPENFAIANSSGVVNWVHSVNLPLGKKWNTGLSEIKNIDADYIMIVGSDDLIDKKLLTKYVDLANKRADYVGVIDLYFMNSVNGRMGYWPGYLTSKKGETIGCARMFRKEIAEKFNYKLWADHLNKSLDGSLTAHFKKINLKPIPLSCKKDDIFVMDLKSQTNIWSFDAFKKINVDAGAVLKKHFPVTIINAINRLKTK